MRPIRSFVFSAVLAALCTTAAAAQDTSRVVRLTLEYNPNIRPNVLVPKLGFPFGDSVRAILQRDFKNGNRLDVVQHSDSMVIPSSGPDYAIYQQLGATFVVQVDPSPTGIRVSLHEVGAKKVAGVKEFALRGIANSYDWRFALHGVSDVLQEWMTGELGIAQTRIAYARGDDLYVIDFDSGNERLVERAPAPRGMIRSPAWHPIQATLAFSAFVGSGWSIGMKPLSGGTTRWLTFDKDGSNTSPVFSPQGTDLYYARQDNNGGNIWNVTISSLFGRRVMFSNDKNVSPAVSPDGSSIIYVSDAPGLPYLYTMGKDGARSTTFVPWKDKTYLESPAWSPDGNTIAIAARRGSEKLYQIETMDVRSKSPVLLTSQGENEDPSWAPDSQHLVFVSNRTGIKQLWVFDRKTGASRQLTHGNTSVINPAWSPRPPER